VTSAFPYLSDFVRALTSLILPLPLPTFGLMVAIAMLVSVWVARIELRRLHSAGQIGFAKHNAGRASGAAETYTPPQEIISDLAFLVFFAGIVGARAFHLLETPQEFLANPWGMIFSRGGFTFYGGLIVGTLVGVAYVKRKRFSIPAFCDALAPAMMLGYAIGRVGCQLSGDGDWGISVDLAAKPAWLPLWFWAQTYENNIAGVMIAAPGVYPTPLYETLMCLLAFAILWCVRKHPFKAGWLFSLYLVLVGVERLLIEQIRVNTTISLFGMAITQAEIISVALVAMGVGGIAFLSRRRKHVGDVAPSA
jgi:phosphatidylglycerol---prolipoprotein diacylglyceryl transferase